MTNEKIETIKKQIKAYTALKGTSIKDLAVIMSEKYNRPTITANNLYNKITNGTLKSTELLEIAETLGYKLEWIEK